MAIVGEIRMFAGNFPPVGWMFCDGTPLPIAENEVLFALIGTTYGGDGQSTFNLPDLRGRVPLHMGSGFTIGEMGGTETEPLTLNQIPQHTHMVSASSAAPAPATSAIDITGPAAYVPGSPLAKPRLYAPPGPATPMAANMIGAAGGSQPHNNMAPYLGISFIISLFGEFPQQS